MISSSHYNLVRNFILCLKPAAKAAVEKEGEKLNKIPALQLTKVRSKKKVIDEARKKAQKFILHH